MCPQGSLDDLKKSGHHKEVKGLRLLEIFNTPVSNVQLKKSLLLSKPRERAFCSRIPDTDSFPLP